MNIVLIDVMPKLEACFRKLGHNVKILRLGGGVFHLPGLLAKEGFSPDLVFQQEALGLRSYFGGLERLSCPTAFWAIDTHLNMFWQMWYARLFDIVFTPHVSLFEALPESCRPKEIRRFAWPGEARAFVPHKRRGHALGLCARVTEHRPIRTWMIDLLRSRKLVLKDGVSHEAMMRFYDHSRVVPNECIANEVNFRLMESASSGSLVLSPDVGEDQNALLEPGKEFLVYRDGLELLDLVSWAFLRPDSVEALGRAAMRRMQAEHLPEHRVRQFLHDVAAAGKARLGGAAALLALWLTLARQIRNGVLDLDTGAHADEGLSLVRCILDAAAPDPGALFLAGQAMAQVFHLVAGGHKEPALRNRALLLYGDILAALERRGKRECRAGEMDALLLTRDVLAAASAFALREGQFEAAKLFWKGNADAAFRPGLHQGLPGGRRPV